MFHSPSPQSTETFLTLVTASLPQVEADVEAVLEREYSEGREKSKVLMYGQEYEVTRRLLDETKEGCPS
eukprot:4794776-Amphidinium_carterae.1